MNLINKIGILALVTVIISGCGGGDVTPAAEVKLPLVQPINTALYNDAWDKAKVYKPFTSTPLPISSLKDMPPSAVAISVHGCDGVQAENLFLGEKYFPIFLAMQGYLVIEPDSYYGMTKDPKTNTKLCYTDPVTGATVYPARTSDFNSRAFDVEYAIAKIAEGNFWNKQTLLVQGQSQGFYISWFLNKDLTLPVTKWLLSGSGILCGDPSAEFTNSKPTLIVNSDIDPSPERCVTYLLKTYKNITLSLISGNYHVPITSDQGQAIIRNFVKL